MTYPDRITTGMRIRQARRSKGWNQSQLGEAIGVEQYTVSDLERDVRPPSGDEALAIALATGRTVGWLLGEPEHSPIPSIRDRAAEWLEDVPYEIPVIDQEAHAGFGPGALILEHAYWPAPMIRGRHIVGLRVRGECMLPEIKPGDTVFVDRDRTAQNRSIVIASRGDELHICRAETRSGRLWLVNNDGDMPADAEDVRIEGVVVQLTREV